MLYVLIADNYVIDWHYAPNELMWEELQKIFPTRESDMEIREVCIDDADDSIQNLIAITSIKESPLGEAMKNLICFAISAGIAAMKSKRFDV